MFSMTPQDPFPPGAACAQGGWMQRHRTLGGVPVALQLWADDRARGAAAMARVLTEWQRLERRFGAQRADSELALVNARAGAVPVRISGELCRLVARARWLAQRTQGLFDVTAAALPPADAPADDLVLARAAQAIGWQHLLLDPVGPTLQFGRPGLRLALGALLRAHAVDAGAVCLQRLGVQHAWLRVGDAQRVLGDRRGRPWVLPLPHPADPDAVLAALPLHGRALCTVDADAAARLRDPRSGRTVQPQPLVAVAAGEGPLAAAWARALQLLGPERGLPLLAAEDGIDALVLDAAGHLHLTPGLQGASRAAAAMPAAARVRA
jgi:thiamine biosynthesis lipoprotein